MRLSWFAELFGKKKTATAPASQSAAPRYRNDSVRSDGGSVGLNSAAASRSSRPLPLGKASEPEEIIPRRFAQAAASAAANPPAAPPASSAPAAMSAAEALPAAAPVPLPAPRLPRERDEEIVRATKMAPQEELTLKVSEGLKNLSTLLSSIDDKMGQQHRATELVAERLQALPRVLEGLVEAERVNLETMRDLRGSMEKQSAAAAAATQKLEQLPSLVDGIGARIEKQTEASASVKTSVESVGQSVRGLVDGAQRSQNSLITEFRRGQDEHRQRFEELVERQRKTILIVAAIGAFVVIALFVVLARLPK